MLSLQLMLLNNSDLSKYIFDRVLSRVKNSSPVVLKLSSIDPLGFNESITGVQRRLGLFKYNALYNQARKLMHTAEQHMNNSL